MIHIDCADEIADKVCICHPENSSELRTRIPEELPFIETPMRIADAQKTVNIFHAENLRLNTGPPLPPIVRQSFNPFDEDE